MADRDQSDNLIRRVKVSLSSAGFDIQKLHIDLRPSVIVVVKPAQYLDGELWNRLASLLQKLGFRWFREEGCWKRGPMP